METSNSLGQSMTIAFRLAQVMRHHPLFFFYLMAFAFAWLAWLPLVFSLDGLRLWSFRMPPGTIGVGTLLGPLLSAFIMTGITEGKRGMTRLLERCILWQVPVRWYLFVLLAIPALILLRFFVLPGASAAFRAPAPSFVLVYLVSYIVVFILGGPLGEEPGWRGFALPRWQERCGPLVGTLILGLVWGLWHFPLFLLPGYNGAGTGFVGIGIPFIAFVIGTMALAVIFTWVFNQTRGSLLLVMLLHASINTAFNAFRSMLFLSFPGPSPTFLSLFIVWIVVALPIIVATRGHLSYQHSQPKTPHPFRGTFFEANERGKRNG